MIYEGRSERKFCHAFSQKALLQTELHNKIIFPHGCPDVGICHTVKYISKNHPGKIGIENRTLQFFQEKPCETVFSDNRRGC